MGIKLNIGAGDKALPGFVPIDRKLGHEAYPLPKSVTHDGQTHQITDGSVDEVRASHVLEHFAFGDVLGVLKEWFRVLKPGGLMRLAVPDFDKIAGELKGDPNRFRYLMGGQCHDDDFHRSVFTREMLEKAMTEAGLINIREWKSDGLDTSCLPVSLNLEGYKPGAEDDMLVRICGVMSVPRVGWNDHWGCHADALRPFQIPVKRYTGAYWDHGIDKMFSLCVEEGVDWMLVMDYDTMFTAEQLDKMLGAFGSDPSIDALAGMQARRGSTAHPLMTLDSSLGDRVIEVDIRKPLKVDTMHFGLTLIRVDALKRMKRPWFDGTPGPDGSWDHNEHVDPDIWFWKRWKECGNTAYVHPGVRIGHLQVMVSEFDDDMNPQHIHVDEWRKRETGK